VRPACFPDCVGNSATANLVASRHLSWFLQNRRSGIKQKCTTDGALFGGRNMLRRRLAHIRNAIAAAPLAFPPGHYYSPVCDPIKIRKWYRSHCNEEVPLPGIDLHRDDQINRLLYWSEFFPDIQFPETRTPPWRYYYGRGNLTYAMGDAVCLYSFIRELSPKKYVEIGSGFSSACVLDTIDQLQLDLQCTFIDPEPARFQALLKSN